MILYISYRMVIFYVLIVFEMVLLSVAAWQLSKVTGSVESNSNNTAILGSSLGLLAGIVLLHTFLWYMYFTYNPISMNMYFLISGAVSMIISIIALAISLINKS